MEFELKLAGFRLYVMRDLTGKTEPPPSQSPAPVSVSATAEAPANGSVSTSLAISKPVPSSGGFQTFLEKAADEGLVFLKSPRVGYFRRSRTIKGKRAPPPCKELFKSNTGPTLILFRYRFHDVIAVLFGWEGYDASEFAKVSSVLKEWQWNWKPARSEALVTIQAGLSLVQLVEEDSVLWSCGLQLILENCLITLLRMQLETRRMRVLFTRRIWSQVLLLYLVDKNVFRWSDLIHGGIHSLKSKSFRSSVYKNALAASIYQIWTQRNACVRNGNILTEDRIGKQIVKEGQVLCYIEQLGGELPIESDVSGEVIKILREDGDPVGYGDALIVILPSFPGIKKLHYTLQAIYASSTLPFSVEDGNFLTLDRELSLSRLHIEPEVHER
uniref:Lipoyl-binding domain-containing protein n=1 Tax=Fagus sylvatica TaxID=28930 RepID=A0A2N9HIZ4_FAGSY